MTPEQPQVRTARQLSDADPGRSGATRGTNARRHRVRSAPRRGRAQLEVRALAGSPFDAQVKSAAVLLSRLRGTHR